MNDDFIIALCAVIYGMAIICVSRWMYSHKARRLFAVPVLIWICETFVLFFTSTLHILGVLNIDKSILNALSAIIFIQAGVGIIWFFFTEDSTK